MKGFLLKRDVGKFEEDEEVTIYLKTYSLPTIPVVILEADKVEEVRSLLDSIYCLAGEGPEVTPHLELFEAIIKSVKKALKILEGGE